MKNKQRQVYKSLMAVFWLNVILLLAVLSVLLFIKGIALSNSVSSNVVFEQYSIIVSLACIPISLKLFHSQYQKILPLEEDKFLEKYFITYITRLFILDAVAILNLAGLYLFDSRNAMYMTIIIIFALFFCYPSKKALDNRQDNENDLNKD
ncbi:hypothetical protein D0T84_15290 [Dysgonomonas sp. 521]|uniref:hypothetical protein n=1 Tax=Dysgonomonas sp. 521 TaxID=2302932 RepID=UPI0013D12DC0|nr:hypothetical protein [Dysgonomonas sp. 521]NDV96265.1 hypothetical protein [Dysgonomonas sp. 521]